MDRARGDPARPPSARPAAAPRAAQPLAPVGLDRRAARRPLRRELAPDGRALVVVGDGPELRRLKRIAGPTVTFTGRVSDERVAELLARARALVVTATEEFGIAAVEALAAGRPVIAL